MPPCCVGASRLNARSAAKEATGPSTWSGKGPIWEFAIDFVAWVSIRQIAEELELGASDVLAVTEQLRGGLVARTLTARLEGEVKICEAYDEAGHKSQPAAGCATLIKRAAASFLLRGLAQSILR